MTKPTRPTRPAPPGCVWIDEASRLTGLAIKTLYKYRSQGFGGPPSGTVARRAVYRLTDIELWLAEQLDPEPSPEQQHESRPAEMRRPRYELNPAA